MSVHADPPTDHQPPSVHGFRCSVLDLGLREPTCTDFGGPNYIDISLLLEIFSLFRLVEGERLVHGSEMTMESVTRPPRIRSVDGRFTVLVGSRPNPHGRPL